MSQTFKSFKDVSDALGFQQKEKKSKPREEKEIKCRVCGAPMRKVPGTNLIACTGSKVDKEGHEHPCKNFILVDAVNK